MWFNHLLRTSSKYQAGAVIQDMKASVVECSSGSGDVVGREGVRLWGRLIFGTGFIQDRYLSDCAAFSEQHTPSFVVAQVTLSLPPPKPLLQFCLYLNTHTHMKNTEIIKTLQQMLQRPDRIMFLSERHSFGGVFPPSSCRFQTIK